MKYENDLTLTGWTRFGLNQKKRWYVHGHRVPALVGHIVWWWIGR